MSQMSRKLRQATNKIVELAESEDCVVVGFVVPKNIESENFGWSLFSSCDELKANDLAITIGEILKESNAARSVN